LSIENNKRLELTDEVSLVDLIGLIIRHWHLLIVFPLIVALATWIVGRNLPQQWEARAQLEIGSVAVIGPYSSIAKIETPTTFIERVKLRETLVQAAQAAGLARESQETERLIGSFSARPTGNTDLVEFVVRADSRETAEKFLMALVRKLQKSYLKQAEPVQRILSHRLEQRKAEMKSLRSHIDTYREQEKSRKNVSVGSILLTKEFADVYVANLESRVYKLASEIGELEVLVDLPVDRPTRLFGDAPVSAAVAKSKTGFVVFVSWFLAFSAGALFLIVRRIFHRVNENRGKPTGNPE
jgi:hypothetical protein